MRKAVVAATGTGLLAVALITLACSSKGWDEPVQHVGTFEEVIGEGHANPRVQLAGIAENQEDGLPVADGELVAVGALEDLTGEVTIFGGDVWLSRVRDGQLTTERGRGIGGKASMLVSTRVREWTAHEVDVDVAPADLADYVLAAAADAGVATDSPFPFRAEGELISLDAHVKAGDCPMHARRENQVANPAPVMVTELAIRGHVVGFYAAGHEGELTDEGTPLHAHVLADHDGDVTAHVESVGLKAGSTLLLPAR